MGRNRSNATAPAVKGDLVAGTGVDTSGVLALGSNGDTLVADSSTSTGLRYTAGNPIPNPVINSCFDIWQRGTSISVAAGSGLTYVTDRWSTATGGSQACTVSRQATNDSTNLPNIQYAMRYQRNSGQTGTSPVGLYNAFETINSIPFAGKTITYSFYARGGATFLSSGASLTAAFTTGTGTDQNPGSGYTGGTTPLYSNAAVTSTWQRFSYTITLSSTLTELTPYFVLTFVGTAGATDFVEITGVQIDIGSVALPVRRNGATIQGELAACQRYYWRTGVQSAYGIFGNGAASGTTNCKIIIKNPSTLRVKAASVDYSTLGTFDGSTVTAITNVVVDGNQTTPDYSEIDCTVASGLTQFRPYFLLANASGSAYIGFSAEL